MSVSLENVNCAVKFFRDLEKLICDVIILVRTKNFWKLLKLLGDLEKLILDAKCALPELSHMNSQDAMAVAGAAYQCIKKIVECASA